MLTMVVFALATAAHTAPPPFAHVDWRPSPTDAAGFAGQGNNWYPGANPPTEWSDTTNEPPRNILWKVPIPGWTDAAPLVVAKRVIGVYSPHYVVCYDADTGKVLWRDELKLMTLSSLNPDGKTITPAPADADKRQALFERAVALRRIHMATGLHFRGTPTEKTVVERKALIEHVVSVLETWKTELAKDWPDAPAAIEADLARYRLARDGKADEYDQVTHKRHDDLASFQRFVERTLGLMDISSGWQGSISDVMATPVSDGEVVCVTMGYGQIAAYELATGKRLWAWRHPAMNVVGANHCASPLLWKDLMLFPAPSFPNTARDYNRQSLMAVDKRSGAVRWETPDNVTFEKETGWGKKAGIHGAHQSPHLMRLSDGPSSSGDFDAASKGGIRALVIGNTGNLIDAETGKSLAQFPTTPQPIWLAGFTATLGNRVYSIAGSDGPAQPIRTWPLTLKADGGVEIGSELVFNDSRPAHGPFALSDQVLAAGGTLADARTGVKLAQVGGNVIVGRLLIGGADGGPKRSDGSDELALVTGVYDISQPRIPRLIAKNIIVAKGYTPDISGKYFPRFAAEPELRRWGAMVAGHCNYQGIGFSFAGDPSFPLVPIGNRLYVQSPAHLYCLANVLTDPTAAQSGEAKELAAIQSATKPEALAAYLADANPRLRLAAVKALGKLTGGQSALLTPVALKDCYSEIRGAAVLALDADDPQRKPGTALLADQIAQGLTPELINTLRAAGPAGTALLDAQIVTAQKEAYYNLLELSRQLGHLSPAVLERVLVKDAMETYKGKIPPGQIVSYLCGIADQDPRIVLLIKEWITIQDDSGMLGPLFQALIPQLPRDQRLRICLDLAIANGPRRLHGGEDKPLKDVFSRLYEPGCIPALEDAMQKVPEKSGWYHRLADWIGMAKERESQSKK